jgi:hypothetical protein
LHWGEEFETLFHHSNFSGNNENILHPQALSGHQKRLAITFSSFSVGKTTKMKNGIIVRKRRVGGRLAVGASRMLAA